MFMSRLRLWIAVSLCHHAKTVPISYGLPFCSFATAILADMPLRSSFALPSLFLRCSFAPNSIICLVGREESPKVKRTITDVTPHYSPIFTFHLEIVSKSLIFTFHLEIVSIFLSSQSHIGPSCLHDEKCSFSLFSENPENPVILT